MLLLFCVASEHTLEGNRCATHQPSAPAPWRTSPSCSRSLKGLGEKPPTSRGSSMPASPRRRSAAEHVQRRLAVVIPLRRSHSWQLAASLMSRAGQAACSRASRPAASTSPPAAWSSARKSRAAARLWSIATLWVQPACSVKDQRQSRPSEFDVVSEAPRAAGDRRAVRTSRRQLHELGG